MQEFTPLRSLPEKHFSKNDLVVIFGEVFQRGYVNGLIEEAKKCGAKIIYATVGRRDENNDLRSLTSEELAEKNQSPLINVPLEAGFDLEKSSKQQSPCEQLSHVKLKTWQQSQLDWDQIRESRESGKIRFQQQVEKYLVELKPHLKDAKKVLFVHTMAGGVPRTKIVMPLLNRVFKGYAARYQSSEEFWQHDIGKLCEANFEDVTAHTFKQLINQTQSMRQELQKNDTEVGYVAYGYHGNELFINKKYQWQSYAPYLQGFAKLQLEHIAVEAQAEGVKAFVYNAPEILTNSSSIFLGIEVALYPLLNALVSTSSNNSEIETLKSEAQSLLKPEFTLTDVFQTTDEYFQSDIIKNNWSHYEKWPQHNGPDQMQLMRETSQKILEMHKDSKQLMTNILSEIVFKACGTIMLHSPWEKTPAVSWIGHDIVTKHFVDNLSS